MQAGLPERFGVVHEAGGHHADGSGPVVTDLRERVEVLVDRRVLDGIAEAELHGLVHRAIVEQDHVEFRPGFLRLQLGQRVGGIAGYVHDLDLMPGLEGGDDLLLERLFGRAAVRTHVEGRLLGHRGRCTAQCGHCGHCGPQNRLLHPFLPCVHHQHAFRHQNHATCLWLHRNEKFLEICGVWIG
ncbi:hypothetical protein D9M72_447800 [compost metagenome]